MESSNVREYTPYSCQRIKQILREDYHCSLEAILWYKCNRKKGYVQKYRMRDDDTGEILVDGVTLNALRLFLAQEGYPLHKEVQRCKGAELFLQYVEMQKHKV